MIVGDITRQNADVIVNAANSALLGGGGVDGAIHQAGGPAILEACRELRRTQYPDGLPTGSAVITTAGDLPARYVIHTVGPVYGSAGGRDSELLAACYENSLKLAKRHSLLCIAFPAISTGVFGYPQDEAAQVSSQAIAKFLAGNDSMREVRLVFFQRRDAEVFLKHQELIKMKSVPPRGSGWVRLAGPHPTIFVAQRNPPLPRGGTDLTTTSSILCNRP